MGACLGVCSLLNCAFCLCGSDPRIICGCCFSSCNSIISLLAFTFLLFLGVLVAVIKLSPGVESHLYKLPCLCEGTLSILGIQALADCRSLLGHRLIYHMYFALAAFFILFTLLMNCVKNSKDP